MLAQPTICVIGSGAVGGYYGARLAQHGSDVHFLLRSDFPEIRERGWSVRSIDGDFTLAPGTFGAANDPSKLPKADLVLVTLKTTVNDQFEPLIAPILKSDTAILTLQNGLGNEECLAALFGREHVLGGIAFTCINRIGPGAIHHIAQGWVRIGEFGGGRSERVDRIAALFKASRIDCEPLEDLRRGRWQKLCWNIPFNGLGTVLDWTTDRLIATPESMRLVTGLMQEVIDGAAAVGAALPEGLADRLIESTRPMGAYLTSMQVDRRQRRDLEIEAILGEPLRQGTGAGAKMPMLGMLYKMAKAIGASIRPV